MLVLGCDIATSSGFTFLDYATAPSQWRCFAVEAEGEFGEDKAGDLALVLRDEILRRRPDFAAVEMPQRSVTRFERKGRADLTGDEKPDMTINPNALQLHDLGGAVCSTLDLCGVPWGLIAPATWRAVYYGKGFKPQDGDWKEAAITWAGRQRIPLPATVKARRDAAESVGIASAWSKCTLIPKRHQPAFLALRTNDRRAA